MKIVDEVIDKIKKGEIVKHWERDYGVFFTSATVASHTIINSEKYSNGALTLVLFIHKNGICSYHRLKKDNDAFLRVIGEKLKKDIGMVGEIISRYSYYGERILQQYKKIRNNDKFGVDFVKELADNIKNIVAYQLIVHRVPDYLVNSLNSRDILAKLEEARKKYESVFGLFETNFDVLCRKMFDKSEIKIVKLLTADEFIDFIKNKKIPGDISEREEACIVVALPKFSIFNGEEAERVINTIESSKDNVKEKERFVIKGKSVYGNGVLRGKVQLFKDSNDIKEIIPGRILVVPSTLPKYNNLYLKAKAIIADEGGVLAHVAILCRENKIPGIIGTKNGTKLIKNEEEIEIDFDKSEVRIIKRSK